MIDFLYYKITGRRDASRLYNNLFHRHRFSQVPGLIHITAAHYGDVVGYQL